MTGARLRAAALPVAAVVALVTVVAAAAVASWRAGTLGFDFLSYDLAVRRFFDGGVLYDQSFDVTGAFGLFYYPPPFVIVVKNSPHFAGSVTTPATPTSDDAKKPLRSTAVCEIQRG